VKHLLEALTTACLLWLPIDLLYLYYAGGWVEPNRTILVSEMAFLYLLPVFAIWRIYHYCRRLRHE